MRTYVTVFISSDGGKASEITKKLEELGFVATLGTHDFVYKWKEKKEVTPEEVINFVDRVQSKLKGMNVRLHFTTVR